MERFIARAVTSGAARPAKEEDAAETGQREGARLRNESDIDPVELRLVGIHSSAEEKSDIIEGERLGRRWRQIVDRELVAVRARAACEGTKNVVIGAVASQ